LWRLPQPGGVPVVETSATHLRLASDVYVDFHDLAARMERLDQASSEIHELAPSSALTGDLLPDWYEDWILLERERFRQLRLHALEALCARLTEAGRFGAAVQAGLTAVSGEPLRESAHRTLIQAHLAEGNPGEAVRQYHLYRRLLADELALEPSAAIRGLVPSRCCGDAAVTGAGHRPGHATVPRPPRAGADRPPGHPGLAGAGRARPAPGPPDPGRRPRRAGHHPGHGG
jgi:DNA-binding SARP family transcriptional activator